MKHLKKFNEDIEWELFPIEKIKIIENIIRDYYSDDFNIEKIDFQDGWNESKNIKYFSQSVPNDLSPHAIAAIKKSGNLIQTRCTVSFVTKYDLLELDRLYTALQRLPSILEQEGLYTTIDYDPEQYSRKNGTKSGNVYIDIYVFISQPLINNKLQ